MMTKMLAPKVPETATDSSVAEIALELSDLIYSPLTGVSQIFLINSPISGAALLGAIAMTSPVAAVHAGAGAAIGTAVGVASGVDYGTIANGLVGFNPCLTSLSVAVFFPTLSLGQVALSTGGAVGTAVVSHAMGPVVMETCGTPAFTLPFCLVATATYGIGKAMELK
jgi:urea transporter